MFSVDAMMGRHCAFCLRMKHREQLADGFSGVMIDLVGLRHSSGEERLFRPIIIEGDTHLMKWATALRKPLMEISRI